MMRRTRKPTSPGEILRGVFLIPTGMTQNEFANHLDRELIATEPRVARIIA